MNRETIRATQPQSIMLQPEEGHSFTLYIIPLKHLTIRKNDSMDFPSNHLFKYQRNIADLIISFLKKTS
jgi:hypothetical protein